MKYLYPTLALLLLAGCTKQRNIEIEGKTPGVKNGVFTVKTGRDSTVYGENLKAEKFSINKPFGKPGPGYYSMDIVNSDDNGDKHEPFEVYLEPGKYTIETEPGKLYKYPKIVTTSKIQQELSAFYTLADQLSAEGHKTAEALQAKLKAKEGSLSRDAYVKLINQITAANNQVKGNNIVALKQFVTQYPSSAVSAHLMSRMNYEDDPAAYYAIYKKFSDEARRTDDGVELAEKLGNLVKLLPGATGPELLGKMPDGKAFNPASITKKYILLEFWKAGNDFTAMNHQKLKALLTQTQAKKELEIVSVSLDHQADWWSAGIRNDNLTWPQVSDLKGNDSPNAANWGVTRLPMYYLLDNKWHILLRDVNFSTVDSEVGDYLRLHK